MKRHTTRSLGFFVALALVYSAGLPAVVGAQRIAPAVGVTMAPWRPTLLDVPIGDRAPRSILAVDTADARRRRHMLTFVLGGAAVGGIVGAVLTTSYTCGEPQQYVTCSSMSAGTGAAIGVGVGVVVGWLLGIMTAPAQPAPSAPERAAAVPTT